METMTITSPEHLSNQPAMRALALAHATWSVVANIKPIFAGCDAMYRFRPEEIPPL